MLNIKILGPGCANCDRLEKLVRKAQEETGMEAEVLKITDPGEYLDYGVMSTPGLVVNGSTVCSGRIPSLSEITGFLRQASS